LLHIGVDSTSSPLSTADIHCWPNQTEYVAGLGWKCIRFLIFPDAHIRWNDKTKTFLRHPSEFP
ncbi:hypothetical protein, partial [Methylomonas methanica]|uniref:hypothetical protein n=1 Tax=Methylomonas methanica TaxID=421 RepID=UPI001E447213